MTTVVALYSSRSTAPSVSVKTRRVASLTEQQQQQRSHDAKNSVQSTKNSNDTGHYHKQRSAILSSASLSTTTCRRRRRQLFNKRFRVSAVSIPPPPFWRRLPTRCLFKKMQHFFFGAFQNKSGRRRRALQLRLVYGIQTPWRRRQACSYQRFLRGFSYAIDRVALSTMTTMLTHPIQSLTA